jgi:hypothetical protein
LCKSRGKPATISTGRQWQKDDPTLGTASELKLPADNILDLAPGPMGNIPGDAIALATDL